MSIALSTESVLASIPTAIPLGINCPTISLITLDGECIPNAEVIVPTILLANPFNFSHSQPTILEIPFHKPFIILAPISNILPGKFQKNSTIVPITFPISYNKLGTIPSIPIKSFPIISPPACAILGKFSIILFTSFCIISGAFSINFGNACIIPSIKAIIILIAVSTTQSILSTIPSINDNNVFVAVSIICGKLFTISSIKVFIIPNAVSTTKGKLLTMPCIIWFNISFPNANICGKLFVTSCTIKGIASPTILTTFFTTLETVWTTSCIPPLPLKKFCHAAFIEFILPSNVPAASASVVPNICKFF